MKLVNTHLSNDCTRKCLVYADKNNHYHIMRYEMERGMMLPQRKGREKFKHIESANRAVQKWVKS